MYVAASKVSEFRNHAQCILTQMDNGEEIMASLA